MNHPSSTTTDFGFTSPLRVGLHAVAAPIASGTALLRPLRHRESAPQQAVFDALSAQSRYSRYLTGVHALTPSMLQALSAVDGHRHVAWLATVDGAPAGIGRFVTTGACAAEVAFEVVDEHQGRGLGTVLLDTVTTVAAAFRIRRLQATVLPPNTASQRLLARVGLDLVPHDGLLEADGPFHLLNTPAVDRPAVVSVAYAVRQASLSERHRGAQVA